MGPFPIHILLSRPSRPCSLLRRGTDLNRNGVPEVVSFCGTAIYLRRTLCNLVRSEYGGPPAIKTLAPSRRRRKHRTFRVHGFISPPLHVYFIRSVCPLREVEL